MKYQLRDYQQEASDAAIRFFRCSGNENGLLVLQRAPQCYTKVFRKNQQL